MRRCGGLYIPLAPPVETACPIRRQSLSRVSGRKRYNTLDFAEQNRVPTGMLLAPIGNPEPRGYSPLDTPCFLRRLVPKL